MSEYLFTEIKEGNTVKHLKGNQEMTVVWIGNYLGKLSANCEWPVDHDAFSGKENAIYRITELGKLAD